MSLFVNNTKIFLESCDNGDLGKVKDSIEAGVDVNCQTGVGHYFALGYAALNNDLDLCDLLLEHPYIDVNARNVWHRTALMTSCTIGHVAVTKKLVQSPNIDLNSQDKYGDTSAIRAVINNNVECVRVLAEIDQVDWNVQDNIGFTAPMWAVSRERYEVLELLMGVENIDWNIKSNNEDTALTLALRNGSYVILSKLLTLPKLDVDVEILKSKSVYNTAVKMFKTQVSEIMVNAENNLIETNITELVFALKNNMDNFSKLLLSTPTNIDILLLCLIFRSNSKRKE